MILCIVSNYYFVREREREREIEVFKLVIMIIKYYCSLQASAMYRCAILTYDADFSNMDL